jgi:uncharacterized membrane protein
MKVQFRIFLVLLFIPLYQSVYYYSDLPETVASHFNSAGHPNGWSSRMAFFGLYLGMMILMAMVFLALPSSLPRFRVSLISLPNKEYWLAPERCEETVLFIRQQMLSLGIATVLFMICTFQLVIEANLQTTKRFPVTPMNILLAAYGLLTVVWLIRFLFRFRKPS